MQFEIQHIPSLPGRARRAERRFLHLSTGEKKLARHMLAAKMDSPGPLLGPRLTRVGSHIYRPVKKSWEGTCLLQGGVARSSSGGSPHASWFSHLSTGEKKLASSLLDQNGSHRFLDAYIARLRRFGPHNRRPVKKSWQAPWPARHPRSWTALSRCPCVRLKVETAFEPPALGRITVYSVPRGGDAHVRITAGAVREAASG
jgi:hypothetical protein